MIDIEIDKLTNSIENVITGDSFATEVLLLENKDLTKIDEKNSWLFDWKAEASKTDRQVYKLVIVGNPNSIQGLVSLSDKKDHILLQLIENAPLNLGKEKIYNGVAGNLFAFACKTAFDKGYDGFVGFISKSQLVEHYQKTLGAVHLGGLRMAIFTQEAAKLVKQYFQNI
jgi:hypothetical protein